MTFNPWNMLFHAINASILIIACGWVICFARKLSRLVTAAGKRGN